jgi:hypothetical protein
MFFAFMLVESCLVFHSSFSDCWVGLVRQRDESRGRCCTNAAAAVTVKLHRFHGGSALDTQVRFPVPAADEMQNERHRGHDKKKMNEPARHTQNNPAKKPGNH